MDKKCEQVANVERKSTFNTTKCEKLDFYTDFTEIIHLAYTRQNGPYYICQEGTFKQFTQGSTITTTKLLI